MRGLLVLAIAGGLINSTAADADRAALLPYLYRACQNQLLANGQFVALLTLNQISTEEVCQCQGPLFIGELTDAQVAELSHAGFPAGTAYLSDRFFEASRLCALNMTVRRSRRGDVRGGSN